MNESIERIAREYAEKAVGAAKKGPIRDCAIEMYESAIMPYLQQAVAAEREQCAKVAEERAGKLFRIAGPPGMRGDSLACAAGELSELAAAIRKRGEA